MLVESTLTSHRTRPAASACACNAVSTACHVPSRCHRRNSQYNVGHVLEDSGSVDWDDKRAVYQAAATVAELRPAVFRALLGSYHAVSGSLDPAEALALLDSLHLPADTEHLPQLRAVLRNGVANHYKDPAAWRA